MKKIIAFLLLTSILACSNPVILKEVNYGIFATRNGVKFDSTSSPSGNQSYGGEYGLKQQTDTIPAEINIEFGLSYDIDIGDQESIFIEKVWTYPKDIITPEGKRFKQLRTESEITAKTKSYYTSYIFEEPFEIVKGEWKLEIFHEGRQLYERSFFIK